MRKVTWRRFDQSAKQLVVGQTTKKYDDPRLKMSHEGAGNDCVSYVLSYDQLQESWIISKLKGKLILKQQSNKRQLLFLITVRG